MNFKKKHTFLGLFPYCRMEIVSFCLMLVNVEAVLELSFWNMGGQLSQLKELSGCCPTALQLGQGRRCQLRSQGREETDD